MTLKWCVFMGVLMLVAVNFTFQHQKTVHDLTSSGVHTRWWDGTVASREEFHENGKLAFRTTYGDDGKTVLTFQEFTFNGALIHDKTRRDDGKVYEKYYSRDGKTLLQETLWVGDESYYVAQREYHDNGQLAMETVMTEDGRAATLRRIIDSKGVLQEEAHINSNASQEVNSYQNGILVRRQTFGANGDVVVELFYEGTEIVSKRTTMLRLDGSTTTQNFDRSGKLLENSPPTRREE